VESRSTRRRDYASLLSVKLQTAAGDRWVEGTVFEPASLRLVSVRGVSVEAPLAGTMVFIANDDQPGVIGEVGTILGRHKVNIASFALGRSESGAVGVVNVDEDQAATAGLDAAVEELRRVPAIREAYVIRLT
jgi:D-3-phosphoglycerate dehydrogenase